jgi:hypothetical protein
MSTFSNVRVGKKPFLAGSAQLTLIIPAAATGVVGQLPAGATLTGVSANEASLEVTIGAAYGTNLTPDTEDAIANVVLASDTDVNVTTAGTAAAVIRISYVLSDPRNGDNT